MTYRLAHSADSRFIAKFLGMLDGEEFTGDLYWSAAAPGDVIGEIEIEPPLGEGNGGLTPPEEWRTRPPAGWDSATILEKDAQWIKLRSTQTGDEAVLPIDWLYWDVLEGKGVRDLRDWGLRLPDPEGVAYADDLVPSGLVQTLRESVTRLMATEPADFHPGSGTKVRDLVHPSLFPYIEGKSRISPSIPRPVDPKVDRFGRDFERSRYQWLPTPFRVNQDGSVQVQEYINNLDNGEYPDLYVDLGRLFALALPLFESVLEFVDETVFFVSGSESIVRGAPLAASWSRYLPAPRPLGGRRIIDRELLVIPKIVDYELAKGESQEGVWHVEGMSHEHIVATCVYVLDREETLRGGDLQFMRPYLSREADALFTYMSSQTFEATAVRRMREEATVPLGTVALPEGRMIVFPNSHIHRLTALKLARGAKSGHRTVIVFWLVDPDVVIPSTREVPPQQGVLSLEEAHAIRLELMEERRRHKQSFNLRAVNLCEH